MGSRARLPSRKNHVTQGAAKITGISGPMTLWRKAWGGCKNRQRSPHPFDVNVDEALKASRPALLTQLRCRGEGFNHGSAPGSNGSAGCVTNDIRRDVQSPLFRGNRPA
jgi:hypothetical protein